MILAAAILAGAAVIADGMQRGGMRIEEPMVLVSIVLGVIGLIILLAGAWTKRPKPEE